MTENECNILIVDDTPENLHVLNVILKGKGYKIRPATNGTSALNSIKKNIPDLILLDVLMPDMTGYDLCKLLKGDSRYKDIPVIFLSTLVETVDKVKAFQAGGVDYITKPFEAGEVLMRIETHLKIATMQRQLKEYADDLKSIIEKQVADICEQQNITIFSLAKLAQSRDDDTGMHLERVGQYCRVLSEQLKNRPEYQDDISDSFIDNIAYASSLHDIGKVGITDLILLKPGPTRLTEEEFKL